MNTYAHMCRDGHEEIGHRSQSEMCPLCVALAIKSDLLEKLKALVTATHHTDNPCDMGVSAGDEVVKDAEAAIAKAEGNQ